MPLSQPDCFVADGAERLRVHMRQEIHARVWATYRYEWARASAWRRTLLRWRIWQVVDEQYQQVAQDRDPYLLW
jgi:hypothetical protein